MAEASLSLPQDTDGEAVANVLTNGVTNGTTNGHSSSDRHKDRDKDGHSSSSKDRDRHSSSHKSSHKDKDKDRHKSSSSSDKHKSSSDKDKERSSDKDKHKSSSSSRDKDKDRHKSSSSSSRDKDKERSKDKDKERSKDKDRSDKDKEKDKERKDKDKERSSDKDKERSSDKDKERSSDKDKERSSDKDKHRSSSDKDKHRSSSDKDKHRSSSDKDKHRSSSDKDKHRSSSKHSSSSSSKDDKHRSSSDKDKKHSSSSSSEKKDKDRHSSSSKSSHKDKHRDKDRDKDRHREKDGHESSAVAEPTAMTVVQEETLNSSQDTSLNTTQDSEFQSAFIEPEPMVTNSSSMEESSAREAADGGASAGESEEDNKLFIHVKEEQLDVSAGQAVDPDDRMESSYVVKNEEPMEDDDDDDQPLSSRKKAKKAESDEDYKAEESDDDVPLGARKKPKKEAMSEEDDDVPLSARRKPKKKRKKPTSDGEEDDDFKPKAKKAKVKKEKTPAKPTRRSAGGATPKSPTKRIKKESEEEKNVWKWWEEEKSTDGRKWTFLEHKGVLFADPYECLPPNIQLKYEGKALELSQDSEEVAGFYARMLEHDYVTKEQFNKNFFKDFRKVMTPQERELITDLTKCDFRKMYTYFTQKNEERKNRTKEEKKALKEKNEEIVKEYGWCIIDGHKQKIANFRAEPPGLFRGRGDHPKMGMLKTRIMPRDVIINIAKEAKIPEAPGGLRWKEVRHDNQVTWLASWTENVQGQTKYVMMNAASKLKGEKDWQKYETARRLHQIAHKIRDQYKSDWKSKEMRIRQRSVALYFIDKLALRAGNEKDEDQADTVGCCSLRVEHITLHEEKDGRECVVAFDFLGKDSIRYYNEVPVEKRAFKNVKLFMENKAPGDDLFDRLNTQIMNKHLNELMEGLTAKVFRTYNASRTLQEQLIKLTDADDDLVNKVLSYNRANREVAILCNHQRAVPKTYDQSMANLQKKIDEKKDLIEDAERDLKNLKRQAKSSVAEKTMYEKKKKQVDRLNDQLHKLEISATDKQENKQIALGTSKLNYLDPRISVAWCKKHDVPIEKVYNKTQRLKFQWALEMATEDYNFTEKPTSKIRPPQNDSMDGDDGEMEEDLEE